MRSQVSTIQKTVYMNSLQITFGKHKGLSIVQIFAKDASYVSWLGENAKDQAVREECATLSQEKKEAIAKLNADRAETQLALKIGLVSNYRITILSATEEFDTFGEAPRNFTPRNARFKGEHFKKFYIVRFIDENGHKGYFSTPRIQVMTCENMIGKSTNMDHTGNSVAWIVVRGGVMNTVSGGIDGLGGYSQHDTMSFKFAIGSQLVINGDRQFGERGAMKILRPKLVAGE